MLHPPEGSAYVLYVNGEDTKSQKKVLRTSIVGAALMIAMVGAVALVASSHKGFGPSELVGVVAMSESQLAINLLKADESTSLAQIHSHIKSFSKTAASGAPMKTTMLEEGDGGASKLCPKADVVIAKLDTLYNKLENGAVEDTDEKRAAKTKMEDDNQAYLDCESEADLAKKEKDEAKEGADYATDQYNNYKDTVDQAETGVIKIRKDTADKIATLNGEDEMIRKILSMLGMIEEVGPSAKGIAAGGRVVEPAQAKAINKQIANLKQAASKMGGVQMQQAARLSNLMAYQETDEVKAILLKMLEDIQTQVDTTNSLLTEAEDDLAEQKDKLNGYQETMVNLNAKHDQAAGALIAANQKRAGCFADKTLSAETYDDLLARDSMMQPSTLKEMSIILRIELKLQEYCGSYFTENGISTGNANDYFKDNNLDLQNLDPKGGSFCVVGYFFANIPTQWDKQYCLMASSLDGRKPDSAVLSKRLKFQGLKDGHGARSIFITGADTGPNGLANNEWNQPVHNPKSSVNRANDGFFMRTTGVIEAKKDAKFVRFYIRGVHTDKGSVDFFMDGKLLKSYLGYDAPSGWSPIVEFTPGFHLIDFRLVVKGRGVGVTVHMQECTTKDSPSSCGSMDYVEPVMSWPPVCGDAVNYAYDAKEYGGSNIGDLGTIGGNHHFAKCGASDVK